MFTARPFRLQLSTCILGTRPRFWATPTRETCPKKSEMPFGIQFEINWISKIFSYHLLISSSHLSFNIIYLDHPRFVQTSRNVYPCSFTMMLRQLHLFHFGLQHDVHDPCWTRNGSRLPHSPGEHQDTWAMNRGCRHSQHSQGAPALRRKSLKKTLSASSVPTLVVWSDSDSSWVF